MLKLKESYYKPIEKDLNNYFYELYWKDIFEALKDPYYLLNSNSALITAIRTGKVFYKNGLFSGTFNSRISKELTEFAKYNKRTKRWEGLAPPNILAASVVANSKAEALNKKINFLVNKIPDRVKAAVDNLKYSIEIPLQEISKEADKTLKGIGVTAEMTPELSERLLKNYTNNQNINITNWTEVQTSRLRDMIEQNVLSGFNRNELIAAIEVEYGVTENKAKFLARQETGLFLAEIRNERYEDAGIELYKWSNSKDVRVVGNPSGKYPIPTVEHGDHWKMGGKICKLSDPTVYADSLEDARNNKWKNKSLIGAEPKHPGQAFGCRCGMIPID